MFCIESSSFDNMLPTTGTLVPLLATTSTRPKSFSSPAMSTQPAAQSGQWECKLLRNLPKVALHYACEICHTLSLKDHSHHQEYKGAEALGNTSQGSEDQARLHHICPLLRCKGGGQIPEHRGKDLEGSSWADLPQSQVSKTSCSTPSSSPRSSTSYGLLPCKLFEGGECKQFLNKIRVLDIPSREVPDPVVTLPMETTNGKADTHNIQLRQEFAWKILEGN